MSLKTYEKGNRSGSVKQPVVLTRLKNSFQQLAASKGSFCQRGLLPRANLIVRP